MARLLIDAEFYLYRLAMASLEEYEWDPGIWTVRVRVNDAFQQFNWDLETLLAWSRKNLNSNINEFVLCTGDKGRSFRYQVFPEYKSNRKNTRKPVGYDVLMQKSQEAFGLTSHLLLEGDDVIGLEKGPDDIVVGIDKDFQTLPGLSLRWSPWADSEYGQLELAGQEQEGADRAVFYQALCGDSADGYPGCPKVGPVTADKLLVGCRNESEMWDVTRQAFLKAGLSESYALQMVQCARILRPGEYDHERNLPLLWQPPVG